MKAAFRLWLVFAIVVQLAIIYFFWPGTYFPEPKGSIPRPLGRTPEEYHLLRGFSPDSKTLFSWYTRSIAKSDLAPELFGISAWDVQRRQERFRLTGAYGWQAFSADSSVMAASQKLENGQHVAKVWNVQTGEVRLNLGSSDTAFCGEFLGNGELLAQFVGHAGKPITRDVFRHRFDTPMKCSGGKIRIWNLGTGKIVKTVEISGNVADVEFSASAKKAAIRKENGEVFFYHLEPTAKSHELGKLPRSLSKEEWTLRFSPDGKTLATGITLWDVKNLAEIRTLPLLDSNIFAFSADSTLCFVHGSHDVLKVYDLKKGKAKKEFPFRPALWGPVINSAWGDEAEDAGYFSRLFQQAVPGGYAFSGITTDNKFIVTEGIKPYDPPKPRGMDEGGTRMISVLDFASGSELAMFNIAQQPFLAPDGKLLAFSTSKSIVLIDMPPKESLSFSRELQRRSWWPMICWTMGVWIVAVAVLLLAKKRKRGRFV
jgi:hypothetical protein